MMWLREDYLEFINASIALFVTLTAPLIAISRDSKRRRIELSKLAACVSTKAIKVPAICQGKSVSLTTGYGHNLFVH